jgi:DnaK suppressor protein
VQKPAPKSVAKAPVRPIVAKTAPAKAVKARAFRREELAAFRAMLQKQLELVQGNLNALAGDNLKRSPLESTGDISTHSTHMADHGTDNFDRELALSLASSRQDSIYDIEDAIRRIDDGEYGACESCDKPIERPRLKALPFAKKCLACQNAAERGRGRYQPFRNNGPLQSMGAEEAADNGDS